MNFSTICLLILVKTFPVFTANKRERMVREMATQQLLWHEEDLKLRARPPEQKFSAQGGSLNGQSRLYIEQCGLFMKEIKTFEIQFPFFSLSLSLSLSSCHCEVHEYAYFCCYTAAVNVVVNKSVWHGIDCAKEVTAVNESTAGL